jgi:hypothetical protein
MEMIFFIVVFPVLDSEDNADEFPFCPVLGPNASFVGSNLLTILYSDIRIAAAKTEFEIRLLSELA